MLSPGIALRRTVAQCSKPLLPLPTRGAQCILSGFHTSAIAESGHSRWSKIKHDKGKNDLRRGNAFGKLCLAIITATKQAGSNWSSDLNVQACIEAAKKAKVPKDRIEYAIKRGQGFTPDGKSLEPFLFEVIGPASVGIIVEGLTDSKLRTLADLSALVKKNNGVSSPAQFLFDRKGLVVLDAKESDVDDILSVALELDTVEDVQYREENEAADQKAGVEITCEPTSITQVTNLAKEQLAQFPIIESGVHWIPNPDTAVELESESREAACLDALLELIEENDDVSKVYTNVKY